MKEQEINFFKAIMKSCEPRFSSKYLVPDSTVIIDYPLPDKVKLYYLGKWAYKFNFYEYGVNICFGWFLLDKMPDQYKSLFDT